MQVALKIAKGLVLDPGRHKKQLPDNEYRYRTVNRKAVELV